MPGKFAILMDGGFIKQKIKKKTGNFPTVTDIQAEVARIKAHPALTGCELLRVYFYDAPPASGDAKNPIDGTAVDLVLARTIPKMSACISYWKSNLISQSEWGMQRYTGGPSVKLLSNHFPKTPERPLLRT